MERAGGVVLLVLIASLAIPIGPAKADVALDVRLDEFPAWVGPGDSLHAVIKISNRGTDPAENLRIALAVHEGVATRSHLERTFAGRLGTVEVSDTVVVDGVVEPGATRTVVVEKPLAEFRFFQGSPEERVYPVRFTVRSGTISARPVDAHMIFFAQPAPIPLKLGLIVPLHYVPVYDQSLRVSPTALRGHEGLNRILEALSANPSAVVTIAPSGLMLETLSDLSDGYTTSDGTKVEQGQPTPAGAAALLETAKRVASQPGTSVITAPYSDSHLVWLTKAGLTDRAQEQVAHGRRVIQNVLGVPPLQEWLDPPAGALDEPTLNVLQRTGVSKVVVSSTSLPRPRSSLTLQAPTAIPTRAGPNAQALVLDPGLTRRLVDTPEITAVQARQRFLAETASIMLERPAEDRVVYAHAPIGWSPAPTLITGILEALARSPWMVGVTPATAQPPATAGPGLAPTEAVLASLPAAPPDAFASELVDAREAIEDFSSLHPPAERVRRLDKKLRLAEASDWWGSRQLLVRGQRLAQQVVKDVQREFAKIRAPAEQTITLTSRTGIIPLVLSTATDYPVRIILRLDSDKLEFPQGTRLEYMLEPPAKTVDVQAIAETSGTFPLRVVLEIPDGGPEVATSRVLVRSTAYNVIAVAITAGAAVFLVAWWLVGASRRRLAA
jgi:hypothetical protein